MQILTGEAFLTLLKAPGFVFVSKFLDLLKSQAIKMLALWNSDILEVWVEVYAITLSKLV